VEELGVIQGITNGPKSSKLSIKAKIVLKGLKLGDSIAVNGVCLTIVNFTPHFFEAQVMAETLYKTNLKNLKAGDQVNLERAMALGDRIGGHLVSGHVDGVGKIIEKKTHDIAQVFKIQGPVEIIKYLVPKGSIAIDGISLTIVDVNEEEFTVSVIPHTRGLTTLGFKEVGEMVNLEIDMIAKYVERFLNIKGKTKVKQDGLSMSALMENGFI
jgi:riboflavin synthase